MSPDVDGHGRPIQPPPGPPVVHELGHYERAEELLAQADRLMERGLGSDYIRDLLAAAQVHATLATVMEL